MATDGQSRDITTGIGDTSPTGLTGEGRVEGARMGVGTRRARAVCAPLCLAAALLLPAFVTPAGAATTTGAGGATGASGASGATAPKPVKVQLKSRRPFTKTGIVVKKGDTVAITTNGTIVFGGGLDDPKG